MKTFDRVTLVKDRLTFIKELSEVREHFRGPEKVFNVGDRKWSHSYVNFSALRIYLALTCFDILGQPNDWLAFNDWLKCNKKRDERNQIFEKHSNNSSTDLVSSVYNEYERIYGVKNSLYNFIHNIISDSDQKKLYNSISAQKRLTEEKVNPDGSTTLATGEKFDLEVTQKDKFLFDIRNQFTHKGIAIGDAAGGLFNHEEPIILSKNDEPVWVFIGIHNKKIGDDYITFLVQRWPFVLIEIIENTIKDL